MSLLEYDLGSVLLLIFAHFLVIYDRAFSRRVRREFQLALLSCFILILFDQHFRFNPQDLSSAFHDVIFSIQCVLRPLVICLLVSCSFGGKSKLRNAVFLPSLVALLLVLVGGAKYCYLVSCIYGLVMLIVLFLKRTRRETADIILGIIMAIMFGFAIGAEKIINNFTIVNSMLGVITCIYYFYYVMRTYKKDRLTGLLIRHNLNYEIEDNHNKKYDLVLIDVDNFKLINDKYGHDKGDEVLIRIVKATEKHLPKGCRMYRFGGDEFVVISRKVTTEVLKGALEATNEYLSNDDFRMSYGIVTHMPGENGFVCLTEADKAMYENKRMIKSQDIWDDMTGLYNLRGFIDELDYFRKTVNKEKHIVCLVGVDVERLSNINKVYGYSEGNLIIIEIAKCLKNCLHGRDFIGHLGSDEFVAAIECNSREDNYIPLFMSQVQDLMDSSTELAGKEYSVKLNIDRYFIELDDLESSEEYVNDLLYMKQEDKDNRRKNDLSESDKDYNEEEDALVQDILDNNRLQYAFQPIISALDGKIVAYESLMRADTETMISPVKILKYAERNKRSYDVEKLTMFNSLAKFADANLPEDVKVFINSIPGHLLNDVDFDVLKTRYGSLMDRVVVEITEQRDIDDDSLALLNSRRDKAGFNLAIDDYGSGASNTNNLLRYTPEIVKLDRLLITGIDRNSKKQFFVNSIISFAKENDMLVLAEGVETERELKTVIKLGVDLIQGYITSKPSVDIVAEIPENIKKIIVAENLKAGSNPRMTYTAGENSELSVVSLAMEDYTRINVSSETITFTGSREYTADMIIKVKENLNCHMTLREVKLNSVDDKPCIELGENTNLTLNIEGTNRLNAKGIFVPDSSSLTIIGGGTLQLYVKGHECFAIGTDTQTSFGKINIESSGLVEINVDGEECVGIGGGAVGSNSEINLLRGTLDLTVAGVDAVGIGTYKGDIRIRIRDILINSVFRASMGAVIGTHDGKLDLETSGFGMDLTGSGKDIAVIGCPRCTRGKIALSSGAVKSKFTGHNVYFIGGESGDVDVEISHCNINLFGEGDCVNGFGTKSNEATVNISECSVELTINASSPMGLGAANKTIQYIGPSKNFNINGVSGEIYDYA